MWEALRSSSSRMSALVAIRIASCIRRSGSKRADVASSVAICSASRALIASGLRRRPRRERLDLIHALGQDLTERGTLALAHIDEIGERLVEGFGRSHPGRLVLFLVAFGLRDLDNALDRQEAVDARRHRVDLAG